MIDGGQLGQDEPTDVVRGWAVRTRPPTLDVPIASRAQHLTILGVEGGYDWFRPLGDALAHDLWRLPHASTNIAIGNNVAAVGSGTPVVSNAEIV